MFQNDTLTKSDKFKNVQNVHHHFACILRYDGQNQGNTNRALFQIYNKFYIIHFNFSVRILEDFETIPIPESTKFHLEIGECPMKYEFLRRPSTIFTSDKSFLQKEYVKSSHDTFIQDYFHFQSNVPYKDQYGRELRLKSRLHWTFAPSLEAVTSIKGKKISDFLLKSDPKLGGVLLYSMKVKIRIDEDDVTWNQ